MVTEREIKDWYNEKHLAEQENAWRPPSVYPVFLDHLDVRPDKKMLDVGCGTGNLLEAASQRGVETYGVDISEEGVKVAQRTSPDSNITVGSGEALRFAEGFFDYVTCLGALEHFLDIDKGISEMIRVAKKDAKFCIVVPNSDWLIYKTTSIDGTDQYDINEKLLSLKQWKNIFRTAGFEIIKIRADKWGKKLIDSSVRNSHRVVRMIYKRLWPVLPLKYTYQFIFIMKMS